MKAIVVKLLVSLILIVIIVRFVDPSHLEAAARRFSVKPVVSALVLSVLAYVIAGVRWWLLLRAQRFPQR